MYRHIIIELLLNGYIGPNYCDDTATAADDRKKLFIIFCAGFTVTRVSNVHSSFLHCRRSRSTAASFVYLD